MQTLFWNVLSSKTVLPTSLNSFNLAFIYLFVLKKSTINISV